MRSAHRQLAPVASEPPTLAEEQRMRSPVEVLGSEPADPAAAGWATAAREIIAANHILATTEQKPWLTEPPAHWRLVGDTHKRSRQ